MKRRAFVLAGIIVVAARASLAQTTKPALVGIMVLYPLPPALENAFRNELRALGYVEGRTLRLEYRSADRDPERLPALAAELTRLRVDVLVAGGGMPSVRAASRATSTIPVVFPSLADPLASGAVRSLARPGGNVTGSSMLESAVIEKRLQLVRDLMPKLQRVAVLWDPKGAAQSEAMETAAHALQMKLHILPASGVEQFDAAFRAAKKASAEAMIVLPSGTFAAHHERLVHLAAQNRLPVLWEHRQFTEAGGLLSYGPDFADMWRAAARYVDRILKGAKPADLPVEQATKLELVINLKAAKALGIRIAPALLVRADQVIE